MKSLLKKLFRKSLNFKIIVAFSVILFVSGTVAATYIILNNNGNDIAKTEEVFSDELAEIYVEDEGLEEEVVEEPMGFPEVIIEEEKQTIVEYKDKEIVVKKAEVAPKNSKEDGQKQKTGGEAISAEKAVQQFENSGQSVGIDVSAHQGKIDWVAVKNSGIEFAIIRAGFRGQTVGAIYEDAYFKTNIANAIKNDIKVGIYFYSCAINEMEALEEAAWLVSVIKTYRITYPVIYDFEDFGRYRCVDVTGPIATANAKAFLGYVANAGYTPMMYANKNDITNRFLKTELSNYKFWLAHYIEKTDYTGSYQMWQYTSKGSVPGITGNVDMNIAYFRYGAVAEPKHVHNFAAGEIVKNQLATCNTKGEKIIRCSCGEVEKTEILQLVHKYSEWNTIKMATITEKGLEKRSCEYCKKEETREIKQLNCEHNYIVTNEIPATCEINGEKTEKCSLCGNTKKTPIVQKHDYKITKNEPATCENDGEKIEKCSLCDDIKTTIIQKTGHSFEDVKDELKRICKICKIEE